jgi:RuvB-like protein 1
MLLVTFYHTCAQAESISVEPDALAAMGAIGARTSLRYSVQMLTPARILAQTCGREKVATQDVEVRFIHLHM